MAHLQNLIFTLILVGLAVSYSDAVSIVGGEQLRAFSQSDAEGTGAAAVSAASGRCEGEEECEERKKRSVDDDEADENIEQLHLSEDILPDSVYKSGRSEASASGSGSGSSSSSAGNCEDDSLPLEEVSSLIEVTDADDGKTSDLIYHNSDVLPASVRDFGIDGGGEFGFGGKGSGGVNIRGSE